MMDALLKTISSVDYEDYGTLLVTSTERTNGDLQLLLDVTADEQYVPRNIRITCHGLRESNLSPGYYEDFQVSEDHVLLWHYTKPHFLTSFYGKVKEPLSVVGALYECHRDLTEAWFPFEKYMNPDVRLAELIEGSFGMLADGPEPLVLAYEEVMQRYGVSTSSHRSQRAMDARLTVIILDKSFVIAERFEANAF